MNQLLIYLTDTWSFFKQHVVHLTSLTIVFILPLLLFELFPSTDAQTSEELILYRFGLFIMLFPFTQILVLQYISSVITGQPVSRFSHYLRALQRWLPLMGFYLLSNLAIGIGIVLFIVPGIFAFVRLIFGEILIVIHKKHPIDAFSQSWQMTKAYQGYLFLGVAVIAVATSGFYFALNNVAMMIAADSALLAVLINLISYVLNFLIAIFVYRVFSDAATRKI